MALPEGAVAGLLAAFVMVAAAISINVFLEYGGQLSYVNTALP